MPVSSKVDSVQPRVVPPGQHGDFRDQSPHRQTRYGLDAVGSADPTRKADGDHARSAFGRSERDGHMLLGHGFAETAGGVLARKERASRSFRAEPVRCSMWRPRPCAAVVASGLRSPAAHARWTLRSSSQW